MTSWECAGKLHSAENYIRVAVMMSRGVSAGRDPPSPPSSSGAVHLRTRSASAALVFGRDPPSDAVRFRTRSAAGFRHHRHKAQSLPHAIFYLFIMLYFILFYFNNSKSANALYNKRDLRHVIRYRRDKVERRMERGKEQLRTLRYFYFYLVSCNALYTMLSTAYTINLHSIYEFLS